MNTVRNTTDRDFKQAGMVAIMVTMVLMIVVSLIVMGFAQISRRNQRQAIDRQLSTQAFYAAETGVNDVRKIIAQKAGSGAVAAKENCGPSAYYNDLNPNLNTEGDIRYTCVLVNPTPEMLRYSDISTTGRIVPIVSANSTAIANIHLEWDAKERRDASNNLIPPINNCPVNNSDLVPTSQWQCGYGVLRIDLVPTSGSLSYNGLQNGTMTTFLVPRASGGTSAIGYSSSLNGANNRLGATCDNTKCSFRINSLGGTQYYMRASSIYRNADQLRVYATDAGGSRIPLANAQVVIDSTGKAQDVLRRIQVYVPINSGLNQMSDYGLQVTDSLCKRFVVMENYFDSQVPSVTSPGNPLCQP